MHQFLISYDDTGINIIILTSDGEFELIQHKRITIRFFSFCESIHCTWFCACAVINLHVLLVMDSMSSSSSTSEMELQPLSTGKSWVWKYFGFKEGDQSKVLCKVCNTLLSFCKNTMNMTMHLKRHHTDLHKEVAPQPKNEGNDTKQNKQLTLTTCFNNNTPYSKTSSRFKASEEALVSFICSDIQPLSIADSVSFIRFVQTLDSRYTMHSRNYYTRSAIPKSMKK